VKALVGLKEFWHKYSETWVGTVIYIIVGFIIALSLHIALQYVLHTSAPVVAVFSDSMVPTFYKGDMMFVRSYYDGESMEIGDIIVFEADRPYPIIHRVYNITLNGIMTKGDNNPSADPWLTPVKNIYGKVILKVPLLGWLKIIQVRLVSF
jgi:signal peptidase I